MYICRVQSCVLRLPKYWPPTPFSTQRVCPPPAPKAGAHTRRAVRGAGVNILEGAWHRIGLLHYNLSTRTLYPTYFSQGWNHGANIRGGGKTVNIVFKGTQEWEFFWLRFWILYSFIVSYVKILRFCKKNFLIGPVLEEVRFFRVVLGLRGMKKMFELGQKNIFLFF